MIKRGTLINGVGYLKGKFITNSYEGLISKWSMMVQCLLW